MRTNRKVSQVWLVVLLSFSVVVMIMWTTYRAIADIEADVSHIISTQKQLFDAKTVQK